MFRYVIIENGPMVQIFYEENMIDESGPWGSLTAAITWADSYITFKNSGGEDPQIV